MWDFEPPRILVGVDDADCEALLDCAVHEAVRRGCGLHLVHVARPGLLAACALDDVVMLEEELLDKGRAVLADVSLRAEQMLRRVAPAETGLAVGTELTHGSVVAALDRLSPHGCLVILQHRGTGADAVTSRASVTTSVASSASRPVLAVPEGWRTPTEPTGVVMAAVDEVDSSVGTVETAYREASRRGARLVIVHARRPGRDPVPVSRAENELRDQLGEVLARLRDETRRPGPPVGVDVVVETGPPGEVLRRQAQRSDLMVLGRRGASRTGDTLGGTPQEVLRWSSTPLLFVDPQRGEDLTRASVRHRTSVLAP